MKSIAIFTLLLSACDGFYDVLNAGGISVPKEVRAVAGETVTVRCSYPRRFSNRPKHWCSGGAYQSCRVLVRAGEPPTDRASASDDQSALTFSLTLTALRPQDEGTYWCVISGKLRYVYKSMSLHVLQPTEPPTTATKEPPEGGASDWWSILRWVLFFLLLACPLGLCLRERGVGRGCVPLCPGTGVHTPPSPLPPLPQTG
ncbi:CMRF35-like molecule 1 [Anguilla anguilla]|uniref:CMRF35-like molecule 1 n=1 Tax=Anguilla anguilla TaxID=7936 RepID=UPI0015AA9A6B|nr:CMRF35-like molecule 1 [Anguilla anguilla]